MKLNITHKVVTKRNIYKKIALVLLALGFQQSYSQSSCADALPITAGTVTVPPISGAPASVNCFANTLAEWYTYTPTENYTVTITSDLPANICKDTHFYIFTGSCDNLNCYLEDDDSGTIECNVQNNFSYLSAKTFEAIAGTTYYIVWDDQWSTDGFDFELVESPFVPSPCFTAIPLTAGTTTIDAIDGANVQTMCSSATKAKWYSYTPTQDYRVTITSDLAANICKNTNFSVYTGVCPVGLYCITSDDDSGIVACNSGNTLSNLSKKTFDVTAGTTYYIAWDNKWSTAGFDFQLIENVVVYPVTYTTQTIGTINTSYNICVVDMNGDGKDDIAGVSPHNLRVHYQGDAGALTYTDFPITGTSEMPGWSLAAGDYNRDGYTDLVLGNSSALSVWKSNDTGTAYTSISPGQYIFCQRTNFIDIDNDGNLDIFSCHDVDPNVYYMNGGGTNNNLSYHQSGTNGAYSLGINPNGGNYASLWTDYDNDGDTDLFISKCSGPPCELHRNDGNGVFTDVSAQAHIDVTPVQSWSSAVADFDNDGDMDILIGSNGGIRSMFFKNNLNTSNNVEEAFTDITAGSGWDDDTSINRDYVAYDFDNDGFVDVLSGGNKIMFNKGNGTFEPINYQSMSIGAIGDLNGDGFLDILNDNTIRYAVPNTNKWLTVVLKGIQSNRNGIGARVEIYGSWGKQIRDIRSGEGFGFMSSLNAHFGIGEATDIEKLVIKWPSGVVDTILNPSINQSLLVVEGSNVLGTDQINSSNFSVYPNPADDLLNIKLDSSLSELKNTKIYDLSGRLVLSPTVANNSISVKNLSTGTYILLLKTVDGKQYTQKFLKK